MTAKIKALQNFVREAVRIDARLSYTKEFQTLAKHWRVELLQTMPELQETTTLSDIEQARAALVQYQSEMFAEIHKRRQAIRAEIEALTDAKKVFDKAFSAAFK